MSGYRGPWVTVQITTAKGRPFAAGPEDLCLTLEACASSLSGRRRSLPGRSSKVHDPLKRLFARVGSRIVPIAVRDITRFQAEDDYVRAVTAAGSHLLYITMAELSSRLQLPFVRVHRSHIINLDCLERVERLDPRRYVVFLKDGTRIAASRSGSASLRKLMR